MLKKNRETGCRVYNVDRLRGKWEDEKTDQQTGGEMDGHTDGQIDKHRYIEAARHTDGQID